MDDRKCIKVFKLFIGWSRTVFILLANIFNYMFHLSINYIVRKAILNESLFYTLFFRINMKFKKVKRIL